MGRLIHIAAGAKSCRKMFVFTNRASSAATQPFKNVETLKNEVNSRRKRNKSVGTQCAEIICERRSQRLRSVIVVCAHGAFRSVQVQLLDDSAKSHGRESGYANLSYSE